MTFAEATPKGPPRERRWAVISNHGDHIWLGRHTDPSLEEVAQASQALASADVPGWLAVVEGSYYGHDPISLLMVRPLFGTADWDSAVSAFLAKRSARLSELG